MAKLKFLRPFAVKALTKNPQLTRSMEDFFSCTKDTIYKMIRRKDERLLSINVLSIIAKHLNMKFEELIVDRHVKKTKDLS